MNGFKVAISILFILMNNPLKAQDELRVLYKENQTIYSKISGQEGKNIDLTLFIYTDDTIRLIISSAGNASPYPPDTISVHEFNTQPIQNSIINLLKTHGIGSGSQSINEILESQSISTINNLVYKGKIFLTSLNDVNRNEITSSLSFKIKVPILIDAKDSIIDKLFKIIKTVNSKLIPWTKDTASVRQKLNSFDVNKSDTNRDSVKLYQEVLADAQIMTANKNKNYYLVGFAFVDRNEIVIDKGIAKAMKIVFQDSIELRYRFGGKKISLERLNISKISEYNFSLDLRSVSFSQKSLNRYLAVWKNSSRGLEYWTFLPKILTYDPPEDSDITDLFVSKRQRIIFQAKNPVITKIKETDLNNIIKLNLFTDLVGIQEDQPNGLIQAEGSFKTHLFGFGGQRRFLLNRLSFFDNLEANLKFSKIENKLRYLDASIIKAGASNVTFIPSFQLLQYQNLETGVKVSAFRVESYKRELDFYVTAGVVRTGIRDTIVELNGNDSIKIPRTYNILTFKKSLQANLKIKATSYMGVDISAELIWLRLLDTDVKQSGANYSRDKNHFEEFNAERNVIFSPQFQVYYLPNKDESKRIYLRGAFFHDLGTKSNSYLQVQVGLSSDINKFLNFK